jgi:hypothetical protein
MAYLVELPERPGVYLVLSQSGDRLGVINGSDGEWYWQINGLDVVYESTLTLATGAALAEANRLENGAPPKFDNGS